MISYKYDGELFAYLYFDFWTHELVHRWETQLGGVARFYWEQLDEEEGYQMIYDEEAFEFDAP